MILKTLTAAVALSAAIALPVHAETKVQGSGPSPYTECGIGAALFKNDTAATISNIIWDLGTTAMTSATSSPEVCQAKDAQAAAFIFESYDRLTEESAHGMGEHFAVLMNILEVESEEQKQVMSDVRHSMANVVSSADYALMSQVNRAEAFYNSVMAAI